MNKILIHTCCTTCLAGVINQLLKTSSEVKGKDTYSLISYFYNPNIHPKKEYEKRLADVKIYCNKLNIPLIIGEYDKNRWFKIIKGLETEPENGQRCIKCYTMRLEQTVKIAKDRGFKIFTTTLTISPHKKAEIINPIGQKIAQKHSVKFYKADFKKNDGFKIACEIARHEKFYKQNYCGCIFSKNPHDS